MMLNTGYGVGDGVSDGVSDGSMLLTDVEEEM